MDKLRSYYTEPVGLDDCEFLEMMVLDGAFLVEYLVKAYTGRNKNELDAVSWNIPLLRRYLLLLENQIPFEVLEVLFNASGIPVLIGLSRHRQDRARITLVHLAISYLTWEKLENLPDESKPETVHHLLHLYHASLHPTPDESKPTLAHIVVKKLRRSWRESGRQEASPLPPSSKSLESILGRRWESIFQVMEIPMLSIQEASFSNFRNLIAFEQSYPACRSCVTSHAVLMNSLISTEKDVALLKEKEIIESKLGQDEEVAELFNRLCLGSYLDYEKHYHLQLFGDVMEYRSVAHHKWKAGLMHTHFGNPWSTVFLITAIFLVLLTVTQTLYTVFAYHHPSS